MEANATSGGGSEGSEGSSGSSSESSSNYLQDFVPDPTGEEYGDYIFYHDAGSQLFAVDRHTVEPAAATGDRKRAIEWVGHALRCKDEKENKLYPGRRGGAFGDVQWRRRGYDTIHSRLQIINWRKRQSAALEPRDLSSRLDLVRKTVPVSLWLNWRRSLPQRGGTYEVVAPSPHATSGLRVAAAEQTDAGADLLARPAAEITSTTNDYYSHHRHNNTNANGPDHGAVYNLTYTPDGTSIMAACEKSTVLAIDPRTGAPWTSFCTTQTPHQGSTVGVNGVRFANEHLFVTGDDNGLVCVWDIRAMPTGGGGGVRGSRASNMSSTSATSHGRSYCQPVNVLRGHTGPVKNFEPVIAPASGEPRLVTCAFDNTIRVWKDYTKLGHDFDIRLAATTTSSATVAAAASCCDVIEAEDVVRIAASPDGSALAVGMNEHITVIANFDPDKLAEDLAPTGGLQPCFDSTASASASAATATATASTAAAAAATDTGNGGHVASPTSVKTRATDRDTTDDGQDLGGATASDTTRCRGRNTCVRLPHLPPWIDDASFLGCPKWAGLSGRLVYRVVRASGNDLLGVSEVPMVTAPRWYARHTSSFVPTTISNVPPPLWSPSPSPSPPRLLAACEEERNLHLYFKEVSCSRDGSFFASPDGPGVRIFRTPERTYEDMVVTGRSWSGEASDMPPPPPPMTEAPLEAYLLAKVGIVRGDSLESHWSISSHSRRLCSVLCCSYSPCGLQLAAGTLDGSVALLQPRP